MKAWKIAEDFASAYAFVAAKTTADLVELRDALYRDQDMNKEYLEHLVKHRYTYRKLLLESLNLDMSEDEKFFWKSLKKEISKEEP